MPKIVQKTLTFVIFGGHVRNNKHIKCCRVLKCLVPTEILPSKVHLSCSETFTRWTWYYCYIIFIFYFHIVSIKNIRKEAKWEVKQGKYKCHCFTFRKCFSLKICLDIGREVGECLRNLSKWRSLYVNQ